MCQKVPTTLDNCTCKARDISQCNMSSPGQTCTIEAGIHGSNVSKDGSKIASGYERMAHRIDSKVMQAYETTRAHACTYKTYRKISRWVPYWPVALQMLLQQSVQRHAGYSARWQALLHFFAKLPQHSAQSATY
jgi:hypothetical protein